MLALAVLALDAVTSDTIAQLQSSKLKTVAEAAVHARKHGAGRVVYVELAQQPEGWMWDAYSWRGSRLWETEMRLDGTKRHHRRADAEAVEDAVRTAPRIPITRALATAARWKAGVPFEIELERDGRRLYWEIDIWAKQDNRVWELTVDGRTGHVIEAERSEEETQ